MKNNVCSKCGHIIISPNVLQVIKEKKLEWGVVSENAMSWDEAINWCKAQGDGWRLPTRIELLQAFEDKVEGFLNNTFWSSTEDSKDTDYAWNVALDSGYTYLNTKVCSNNVRCVRP